MSEGLSYLINHQQFLYGVLGGFALGHLDDIVAYLFHALMMIAPIRAWIVKNPDKATAIIDAIQKDLDLLIIKEAKDATPPKQ